MARPKSLSLRLVVAGIAFIFGGEMLCLAGPLRYERLIHLTCHSILYAGIVLVCIGAGLHWTDRFRSGDRAHRL
jgi:hypothetical protein